MNLCSVISIIAIVYGLAVRLTKYYRQKEKLHVHN